MDCKKCKNRGYVVDEKTLEDEPDVKLCPDCKGESGKEEEEDTYCDDGLGDEHYDRFIC